MGCADAGAWLPVARGVREVPMRLVVVISASSDLPQLSDRYAVGPQVRADFRAIVNNDGVGRWG
jgi:hypothetical protein